MNEIKNSYKIKNDLLLIGLILFVFIFILIFELCVPYFLFPFYLGRNPNYSNLSDLISITLIELGSAIIGLYVILIFLRDTWEIEISKNCIILRDKLKKERKFLLKDIRGIDKIQINNEGFKTWALIGKENLDKKIGGNKIPLAMRDKDGEKLKMIFIQYKQNQKKNISKIK